MSITNLSKTFEAAYIYSVTPRCAQALNMTKIYTAINTNRPTRMAIGLNS